MPAFQLELRGRLAAPVGLVWSSLVDREGAARWLDDVESVGGDGSSVIATSGLGNRPTVGTVTEIVPYRRLSLALRGPSALVRSIGIRVDLVPHDGGTEYRLVVASTTALLGLLLLPWLRLRTEIALHRALRGFRSTVEEEARTQARHPSRAAARAAHFAPGGPEFDFPVWQAQ